MMKENKKSSKANVRALDYCLNYKLTKTILYAYMFASSVMKGLFFNHSRPFIQQYRMMKAKKKHFLGAIIITTSLGAYR